jgi:HAD superfamily hydrolase (TIGR01490 family)
LSDPRAAAFFDVDGTLVSTNIVHAFAYFAANQGSPVTSIRKTLALALRMPLLYAAETYNRKTFNDIFYQLYSGMSDDRLHCLADDLFEGIIKPSIFPGAYDLLQRCRDAGLEPVLVTGSLDVVLRPLAEHFDVTEIIANRLEMRDDKATGRLLPPVVAGATKARLIRDYARGRGYDLEECQAYSDSHSDFAMLASVGRPAAVNPDWRLKGVARAHDWPVLDLGAKAKARG